MSVMECSYSTFADAACNETFTVNMQPELHLLTFVTWCFHNPSPFKVITDCNHFDYVQTERDSFTVLQSN